MTNILVFSNHGYKDIAGYLQHIGRINNTKRRLEKKKPFKKYVCLQDRAHATMFFIELVLVYVAILETYTFNIYPAGGYFVTSS